MATKTASIRLEKDLYDRIDERCVTEGCCRNDFIKSAIESKISRNLITHARIVEIDGVPVTQRKPEIVVTDL